MIDCMRVLEAERVVNAIRTAIGFDPSSKDSGNPFIKDEYEKAMLELYDAIADIAYEVAGDI